MNMYLVSLNEKSVLDGSYEVILKEKLFADELFRPFEDVEKAAEAAERYGGQLCKIMLVPVVVPVDNPNTAGQEEEEIVITINPEDMEAWNNRPY